MLIRYLRRGLRLLTMLAIIISVLVACNTGDTPIAISPPLSSDPSQLHPLSGISPELPFPLPPPSASDPRAVSLLSTEVLHPNLASYTFVPTALWFLALTRLLLWPHP